MTTSDTQAEIFDALNRGSYDTAASLIEDAGSVLIPWDPDADEGSGRALIGEAAIEAMSRRGLTVETDYDGVTVTAN